tara:strand:+ start:4830 stop:5987 length:1158 start_codon:yes stop_codon:yes gene_type:complete
MENLFNNKNILIIKKKKYSSYYDFMLNSMIGNSNPNNVNYIEFSGIKDIYKINKLIEQNIISKKIDILIAASYFFFNPNILLKIQKKILRIRLDGDDDWLYQHYTKWYAQLFDINITTSNVVKIKLQQLGYNAISIPYFYDKYEKPSKFNKALSDQNVVFVGIIRGKHGREKYINFLSENNIQVNIYGEDNYKLNKNEMDFLYHKSKIILNFSGVNNDMKDVNKFEPDLIRKTQIKARVFEVLRTGGFLLTEYTPDLEYFFEIDRDLVTFNSKEELLEKIKYYLDNKNERIRIAKSGYDKFNNLYQKNIYTPYLIKRLSNLSNKKIYIKKLIWPLEAKRFISRFVDINDFFKFLLYDRSFLELIKIKYIFLRYYYSILRYLNISK